MSIIGTSAGASSPNAVQDFKEFTFSKEVEQFIAGFDVELSEQGLEELSRYEDISKKFLARQKQLSKAAEPETSLVANIHSATPKVQAHKVRVKKTSQYLQSPFDGSVRVTADDEAVYDKIMLSSKHQRPAKSNLKK